MRATGPTAFAGLQTRTTVGGPKVERSERARSASAKDGASQSALCLGRFQRQIPGSIPVRPVIAPE